MSEYNVDVGHFKMIVDYYERKCPCWGGRHFCPCPPFVETRNCRCGAVYELNDPKGKRPRFKTYRIHFDMLAKIINNEYKCPEEPTTVCLCKEFLETGKCKLNVFEEG